MRRTTSDYVTPQPVTPHDEARGTTAQAPLPTNMTTSDFSASAAARTAPLPAWLSAWLPGLTQALLRVMTGALFMQHGAQKLFGLLADPNYPWTGAPPMFSQLWFAGVLEVFGGALIVLGLFTRPVAFLLAGQMAVAYFQFHGPQGFWPVLNGGVPAVLFCFVFLHLFAAGAGPFSVDAALRARRGAA